MIRRRYGRNLIAGRTVAVKCTIGCVINSRVGGDHAYCGCPCHPSRPATPPSRQRIQTQGLVPESTAGIRFELISTWVGTLETCDSCNGTGSVENLPCYTCKGAGTTPTWTCEGCKRRTQHERRECECGGEEDEC